MAAGSCRLYQTRSGNKRFDCGLTVVAVRACSNSCAALSSRWSVGSNADFGAADRSTVAGITSALAKSVLVAASADWAAKTAPVKNARLYTSVSLCDAVFSCEFACSWAFMRMLILLLMDFLANVRLPSSSRANPGISCLRHPATRSAISLNS